MKYKKIFFVTVIVTFISAGGAFLRHLKNN